MKRNNTRYILLFVSLIIVVSLSACVPMPVRHADLNNPIKTVAVLPMVNQTNDVGAPQYVRTELDKRLPAYFYSIKPLKDTDQLLRDQMGVTLGAQLDMTTPQKLGELLGVDAVIFGTLMNFETQITGVINIKKARAKFKMVNTKTGETIWQNGIGIKSETKTGGIGSALSAVGAIKEATQKEDIPWVTIESKSEESFGGALLGAVAEKAVSKVLKAPLKVETNEMLNRILATLPVGPGTGQVVASVPPNLPAIPPPPQIEFHIPAFFEFGKRDFTALMIMTSVIKSNNEKTVFDAKLAKLGEKFRNEIDMTKALSAKGDVPPGFGRNIFIVRPDKKLSYILYPDKNKYIEQEDIKGIEEKEEMPKIEKKKVGTETVDGHPCDKYEIKITYKDGKSESGLFWEATDLDRFIIKSEMENADAKTVIEIKNVKLGSPSITLFEVPQGYVKASSMMEIMMDEKH